MPRIRTIKPEFFTSEQIVECSPSARLLFVGLWCFCDDGGVHPASLARLKMEVIPADPVTIQDIGKWIEELKGVGLIESYLVDGKEFWHVTGWHHQRIDKPTYTYPRSREFGEASARARRVLSDSSPPERNGMESKGTESKGTEDSCGETDQPSQPPPIRVCEPAVLEFPCDGKPNAWRLTESQIALWKGLFPSLDILAECRAALAWVLADTTRRKTARGMPKFLVGWFGRTQNQTSRRCAVATTPQPAGPVNTFAPRERRTA